MTDEKQTEQSLIDEIIADIQKNNPNKKVAVVDVSHIKKAAAKELPKDKPKYYWDVKVETTLPATLTYRVFAEDAKQAAELIRGMAPTGVKYKLAGRKDIKLSVYKAGTVMLEWVKNLLGR